MKPFILDHMLKEEFSFPDPSFPIQFYIDDLHQWPDGQVPLHWHLRYEIFSAFKQEVMVQIGEKRLILLPGESILIGGGQLHGYSLTDSTRECLCPNIVFTENILAPLTSTIFQKYFYPILNDPSLPHIKLSQYIPWQKQMLLCLFRVYQFLAGDVIYAVPQLSTFLSNQSHSECPELEVHHNLFEFFKILYNHRSELDHCSATSFLRNWDSILEKKRANLRSISEPARLRQPPPRSTGAAHARGRAQSIREERRIAAPPVLFALLWVRLLPALYGPFCGPLRPFGGCPWGVTPPARECLPPAPPDTRRRG